jgi:hypothetical protein
VAGTLLVSHEGYLLLEEELMGSRCRCGTEVQFAFNHLGCIECGAACCPACSYQLESTNYCSACAETLLELPWARAFTPPRPAVGLA